MNKEEIINRIGFLRSRANLSARALSMLIGMNEAYINRLESKKDFLPSLEVLFRIIEVCGSSVEEFFYNQISAHKSDSQIIELLKGTLEDKKQAIITLLKK